MRVSARVVRSSLVLVALIGLSIGRSNSYADNVNAVPPVTGATAQMLREINRPASERYLPVSLMQLIVDPKKYDRQRVVVFGYLSMGPEWQSIYFDEDMYRLGNRDNAIGVVLDGGKYDSYSLKDIAQFNCRYGSIAGIFVADAIPADIPHAGTLKEVQLIAVTGNASCKSQ